MRRLRNAAFPCAILLGLLADLLLRAPGRPGLNVLLWALAGGAALAWLGARRGPPVARESRWLIVAALGFTGLLVLRDADALAVFEMFAAVALLGLAAGHGALAWARRTSVPGLAISAVRVASLIALGPLGWHVGGAREAGPEAPAAGQRWRRVTLSLLRGVAMALLPLLVLVALLTSADPVFDRLVDQFAFTGLEALLPHLALAALLAWLSAGYLRAFLVPDEGLDRVRLPRPSVAPAELALALGLIAVVFLAFVAVQARYLFGGASLVGVTPGLGYADYARRGFFEMVAAVALVLPLLLLGDWAAGEADAAGRAWLRGVSCALVVLLFGVLASAAWRMQLYQQAYGLTEARVYGSLFMAWLAGTLALLAFHLWRRRRRGFAFGALALALAGIVALHLLDPHALVARVNLARAAAGAQYDGAYLRSLSADAVPTLLAQLPTLPATEQCRIEAMLAERWSGERPGGWRTWNLADATARRLVARSGHDKRMDRSAAVACDGRDPGGRMAGRVAAERAP